MSEHLNEDTCLDLLRGFLTAKERERALSHAATCGACERLFVQAAAREERVHARGALLVQPAGDITVEPHMRTDSAEVETAARWEDRPGIQTAVSSWKRFLRPAFAVAAVAAVVVTLLFVLPMQRRDPMSELLHPMAELGEEVHLRSDFQTGANDNLSKGIEAYLGGDLRVAADLLEDAEATGQLDNLRCLYLASAYARMGEYENAVELLEPIPFVSIPDPWGGEGRWTLYVSLRALGRNEEAESILAELAREPGEFGDRARDVLGDD